MIRGTFASFASMWLIPRLEQFQRDNPDIDIRIDATDHAVDLQLADVDLALRHGPVATMPPNAKRLFGEQLTPVVSPWLLKGGATLARPADVAQFTLIEAGDAYSTHLEWLTWRRWFDEHGLSKLQPKRWLYFNYAYQMVQAALTGQGVVLARLPLVAESVANGDLVDIVSIHRYPYPGAGGSGSIGARRGPPFLTPRSPHATQIPHRRRACAVDRHVRRLGSGVPGQAGAPRRALRAWRSRR